MGKLKTGDEHITFDDMPIGYLLRDYWAWNSSDLLNNTLRGSFCEFIVSSALEIDLSEATNADWGPYDVTFPYEWYNKDGKHDIVRIEVKSCAYLQAWEQKQLSNILFSIRPTRAWDSLGGYSDEVKRQSDAYVFCLYTVKNREEADPLKLEGWTFYIVSTQKINEACGPQKTISLSALKALGPIETDYLGIKEAIIQCIKIQSDKTTPPVILYKFFISVLCIITEQPRTFGTALFRIFIFFWRSEHEETS